MAEATSSGAGREPENPTSATSSRTGCVEPGSEEDPNSVTSSRAGRELGPEEDTQAMVSRSFFQSSKSLSIITIGKTGAGKSSLVRDLLGLESTRKPSSRAGIKPVTTAIEHYEIAFGDDMVVKIYDTPGLFNVCGGSYESETLREISEICTNDVDGVLLICIEMHQRVDKTTLETLARIHRRHGKEIWGSAVIVLTKADQYPRSEWLESKKWWQNEQPMLKKSFEEDLTAAKDYLQSLFTTSRDVVSDCYIGLTEEEFKDIPILPTSKLCYKAMIRMEMVGHESWFTDLLVECCKGEKSKVLVKIHSKRLWKLPKKVLLQLVPRGLFGLYSVDFLQDAIKSLLGEPVGWKMH